MNKDLIAVFEYMEREKGIKREIVIDAIEESLRVAARKSVDGASNVTVQIHSKTGKITVFCEKEIVDDVEYPSSEILLEDAQELDPDAEIGQFIDIIVTPKDFGRIAAQKARQVITQKLRNAERDVIYEEYRHRLGDIISGTIKRTFRGANLVVDLGKVEAILPTKNYPRTEKYRIGERIIALMEEVRDTENEGAEIILSRSSNEFFKQLLIQEVPEINDSTVIVEKIVREPGFRTKVAVSSSDFKVDPVGACVGMRGMRVKNIIRELNEKIDIIPYHSDPIELLQQALSPIEIKKIRENESNDRKVISIVVNDEDYPIVIGKKGVNARLTGRLIDAELEVQRMSEYKMSVNIERNELAESDDPSLDEPFESIEGVNSLVLENLISEGFNTPRLILLAAPEQLEEVPGMSIDIADKILEHIRKERI
jgi:N utilization substance protein A